MKQPMDTTLHKKRLKLWLGLFFLLFAVPVSVLTGIVYRQLQNEASYQARRQAEQWAERLESALQDLIAGEQRRPSADYSFFNVSANPLIESSAIKFSPLSEVPPKTDIPGIVGYFRIDPDGSFHIPALPELEHNNHAGLSTKELASRLALKRRLQDLLAKEKKPQSAFADADAKQSAEEDEAEHYIVGQATEKTESLGAAKKLTKAKDADVIASRPGKQQSGLRQNRKEQVQLPNQAMASSFFKRPPRPVVDESSRADAAMLKEAEPGNAGEIEIMSFESEISPLQLLIVKQHYFCFYRHVWHDNSRYTQGFLVAIETFFNAVTQSIATPGSLTSISILHRQQMLSRLRLAAGNGKQALYKRPLNPPFDPLELQIIYASSGAGGETRLVDLLAGSIAFTLIAGLWFFYRLLSRQIELSRQQRNFISAVSHELKTPITSIRMYGEMLRSGWIGDERKKQQYYDFIFFESERLSRLIANVLQLARIDHRRHPLELQPTPAASLLQRIPEKIEVQVANAGFKVDLVAADQEPPAAIEIDEDAFFQIIINLVDNALKFAAGAEKPVIDIGYRLTAKWLEFYVRDYGPGIARRQQDKIFRLFYRPGDELTRATPGTGIGLALVAQLAASMQAKVSVVNRSPGAEFQIRFAAKAFAAD
ncbi:sensor histidine kinase [Methylomarinum vadi]|uniref:sensor histidine kinase n=1 Tax=Methylomarinum vadi TaxID=438855 RepID=UPI000A07B879|nr:HAMP domain-containing sensor histidine kinase [Methylomarinum vadi]